MDELLSFPHRPNKNGTFDSICPHCLLTVCRNVTPGELSKYEAAHICDPEFCHIGEALMAARRRHLR